MKHLLPLLFLLLASPTFAQMQMEVSATSVTVKIRSGTPKLQVFAVQGHTITDMYPLLGSQTDYTLTGSGTYLVIAVSPNGTKASIILTIDGATPLPDVDPPNPPNPPPIPVVDNQYNVGSIAYTKAVDAATAKTIAAIYEKNAMRLFGETTRGIPLADIKTVSDDIAKQFDLLRLPQEWVNWKLAVNEAQVKEQIRRKTELSQNAFSRDDWFKFYTEITKALETVK